MRVRGLLLPWATRSTPTRWAMRANAGETYAGALAADAAALARGMSGGSVDCAL